MGIAAAALSHTVQDDRLHHPTEPRAFSKTSTKKPTPYIADRSNADDYFASIYPADIMSPEPSTVSWQYRYACCGPGDD